MKRVLDVGQCGYDHGNIKRLIQSHFSAEVEQADTAVQALHKLREQTYDLVLVNRVLDANGSSGLELVKQIKQQGDLAEVPVMLVSNYPDAQEAAVEAGAVPGFGKSRLHASGTQETLAEYLQTR